MSSRRSKAPVERRVVTFYSYKGGTGRSMALANVAWLLAFSGRRVLVIDWDLEAPGVHRYFHPFLEDKNLASTDGLFDFVENLASRSASTQKPLESKDINILDYVSMLSWPAKSGVTWERFGPRARIDLLPAGRQSQTYSRRLNSFSWSDFYERLQGRQLLERAREQLCGIYDYVLIDSRTGVSDTSGICTIEMPDTLVVCFTLNDQSILGASGVAQSIVNERNARVANNNFGENREIRVLPVPMRVEVQSEKLKRDVALKLAETQFASFVALLNEAQRRDYWGNIQAQYIPFYAFEEIPAVFGDSWTDQLALVNRFRHLANQIVGGRGLLTVRQFADDFEQSEVLRRSLLKAYLRSSAAGPDNFAAIDTPLAPAFRSEARSDTVRFFISHSSDDRAIAKILADELMEIARGRVHCYLDQVNLQAGRSWDSELTRAITEADWLICIYTGAISEFAGYEVGLFAAVHGARQDPESARVTCLYDREPLPTIFSQYQNCLVEFPESQQSREDESFYGRSSLGRFFHAVYAYKDLYVARDAGGLQRQMKVLAGQVKRVASAFEIARGSDVRADTPTQLGIEITVRAESANGSMSKVSDDAIVRGTYHSFAVLGLSPPTRGRELPETTWRVVRETTGRRSPAVWMDCLERDMVDAANQRTLTGMKAPFRSGPRVLQAVLARHIQLENGDNKFQVILLEETAGQVRIKSTMATVLDGLVRASHFRFEYLQEPDVLAVKFSDSIPDIEFEANCWQLRYDLDRSQNDVGEFGIAEPQAFIRAFRAENRAAVELLVKQSIASREKLVAELPAPGEHMKGKYRPQIRSALEDFFFSYRTINDRLIELCFEAYRNVMLEELGQLGGRSEHPSAAQ